MVNIPIPNLSEIGQSAAELLTINDRFFVRFRGYSNTATARGDFKNAWTDLHQTWWEHCRVIATHVSLKDILLGFQTTAAQTRALLSNKAKNRTFWPPVKIRGGMGEMSG